MTDNINTTDVASDAWSAARGPGSAVPTPRSHAPQRVFSGWFGFMAGALRAAAKPEAGPRDKRPFAVL